MAFLSEFKALMRKNMITLRRKLFMTIMEILFPIVLMLIGYLVEQVFGSEEHLYKDEGTPDEYLIDKGNFGIRDILTYSGLRDYITDLSKNPSSPTVTKPSTLSNLDTNAGIWHYIDPLNRVNDITSLLVMGLPIKPLTSICYQRFIIAFVGDKSIKLWQVIGSFINVEAQSYNRDYKIQYFDTIEELNAYILADNYGTKDKPAICFGVFFKKEDKKKYKASLHYFDNYVSTGVEDVPNNFEPPNQEMQQGPNMNDILLYSNDGYIPMMNFIANYILKDACEDTNGAGNCDNVYINYGFAVQKYDSYRYNQFSDFAGLYVTFFIILAYLCPLILYVLRMVVEKESRSKEVMKIMGMGEGSYFLSYFLQFFVLNIIYAFGVGIFTHMMFNKIPYLYLVLFLWLFGLNVFALAFFCQSFMDSTRLALIISCLIYCLMLFVSAAVYDETTKKTYKVVASLLPPVNLFLGCFTLGVFPGMFYQFKSEHVNKNYRNYSLETTYLMFTLDFFIYLFLGYYLQNVIPHEFGITRPWYFLFQPSYWCKKSSKSKKENENEEEEDKKEGNNENNNCEKEKNENGKKDNNRDDKTSNISVNQTEFDDNPHKGEEDFQNEDLYRDRDGKNDVFKLRKVKKIYSDGKMACNNISFNLFRNEIFALLGRNGAGKTSLINVLIGMYEATSGEAKYKGENILGDLEMDNFRRKLGICPQHDILFPELTIREHLEMFCNFKGFDPDKIDEEVTKTLKDFRMHDIENVVAKTLSAGQRRKLSIAISVIGGSEVIFLDEPSSGMDITSRRNLWEILKKIIEKRIIILTTHYMEEASVLGNRIGIMAEGVLKCIGTPLFLIEKYGKYMSVTVIKEKDAPNEPIIKFFESKAQGIEKEILTTEILFRIPKTKPGTDQKNIDISSFFAELDSKCKSLKIKSYSAAMPTLEDVFLNIGSVRLEEQELMNSGEVNEEENDRIMFKQKYIKDFSACQKFFYDLGILFKKRAIQIIRDKKAFMLEIICPILLVLVGCLVVQIDIFSDTEKIVLNNEFLSSFGDQVIYYGSTDNNKDTNNYYEDMKIDGITNVTSEFLATDNNYDSSTSIKKKGLIEFIDKLYEKSKDGKSKNNFGALYKAEYDTSNHKYSLVEVINGQARQSPMLYAYVFLNKVLEKEGITFNYEHYPLPTTKDIKENSKSLNNFCLVFFVSISFSLIPANFVSSLVVEKANNAKHLMKISGVSLFAYWLVNYIFELVKYYVTGGVCILLLWAFDFVPNYLYILYLLYGPGMISSTYLLSFLFNSDAIAQNFLILFNLVLGSLASTVIIMLRILEKTTRTAKYIAYAFRIIPSFAFGFGYNLLLNGKLIKYRDYGIEYVNKPESINIDLQYAGSDALYLGAGAVVYMIIVSIIEANVYSFPKVDDNLLEDVSNKEMDENVKIEIEKVNEEDQVYIANEEIDKDIKSNNKLKLAINKKENGMSNGVYEKAVKESGNSASSRRNLKQSATKNKGKKTVDNDEAINENNLIIEDIDENEEKNSTKKRNSKLEVKDDNNNNQNDEENEQGNYKNINKDGYAVKIKNLQKIYSNGCCSGQTVGVKNVSFAVDYGECFGMLGLNGAGKTTIFKALTQEHGPSHGSIYVNSLNVMDNFDEVKLMFGYCPQFDAIFTYMTVYENLEFYSKIKGVDPDKIEEVTKAMIEAMTLTKYRNKQAGRLSGGNKRKLSVAISMICNPPIVLLDEPSTGMDPEARRFMWAVIHKLTTKNSSNCVIMTTHSMDEAETLCRRMGIMVNGEFVCLGTANYIKEKYGYGYEIDVRIKPVAQEIMNEKIAKLGVSKSHKIHSIDEAKEILKKMGYESYGKHLCKDGVGKNIYNEINLSGNTSITTLISWTKYVYNSMKMIKVVLPHFKEVILTEFIENNYLFKMKKEENSKSIGFLFTLLEKDKEKCEITEYSIQQTSLEQIFNKFAENQGKTEEDIKNSEKKVEVNINNELLKDFEK